jgi:hypothetical protein
MTEPLSLHYMHLWCGMLDHCKTYIVLYLKGGGGGTTTSDYGKTSHRSSREQGA